MSKFNIMGVTHCSAVDGPKLRTVIWFQGCKNHCPGCHNPDSWDTERLVQLVSLEDLITLAEPNKLEDGLTLSGGDPFWQKDLNLLGEFISKYKSRYLNKTIWLYTGLTIEELFNIFDPVQVRTILSNVDVLVDGRFKKELRTDTCIYRGSSNQRLIKSKYLMTDIQEEFDASTLPIKTITEVIKLRLDNKKYFYDSEEESV